MRDINRQMRQAYKQALSTIGLPVYYQRIPNDKKENQYIVFKGAVNSDTSTKASSDIISSIPIEIHTYSDGDNNGNAADNIADLIYGVMYNIPQFNLVLNNAQIVSTSMQSDVTDDIAMDGNRAYIGRTITLRHNVFVDGEFGGSSTGNISGRVQRLDFTGVEGENTVPTILDNQQILEVVLDGIGYGEILSTGTPIEKQVKYEISTGLFTFPINFDSNVKGYIIYQ